VPLHTSPSSHEVPSATGSWSTPLTGSQLSAVQGLSSSRVGGVPATLPDAASQGSVPVHALPSSQLSGVPASQEPAPSQTSAPFFRISRMDLIASKVMSSPKRPHDLEDLRDLKATNEELDFVEQHIDRLEAEDLDRREFSDQRAVLRSLRGDA
jgi:hypothetical protein